MKERGIIFTGESVRAILDGRKTQTRRVCKGARELSRAADWQLDRCPYGVPGDRLYVKETWRRPMDPDGEPLTGVEYRGDAGQLARDIGIGWKSSMFMPRWASRLTLEVVAVRVERLQEITEADAIAEGAHEFVLPTGSCWGMNKHGTPGLEIGDCAAHAYALGWDSINRKRAPWASNPWVWVVEFRRLP